MAPVTDTSTAADRPITNKHWPAGASCLNQGPSVAPRATEPVANLLSKQLNMRETTGLGGVSSSFKMSDVSLV